jgi:SAM-dependent methyltransferase
VKVNLGCGSHVPDGWVNVDYALGAKLAKVPLFGVVNRRLHLVRLDWDRRILVHDLRKRFPWDDASVDVVYSSHLLEHLSREEGRRFLGECHRVLRAGGILRLVVPDLWKIVHAYTDGRILADGFVEELEVLSERSGRGVRGHLAPLFQFPHKCMYDGPRLLGLLDEMGFEASARRPFDSDIGDIADVEVEESATDAVVVEGRKRTAGEPRS